MVKSGPFFKRLCIHTAAAGFVLTWVIGLARHVSPDRIFLRSLLAAIVFWMLGAFMARWAFRPFPPEPAEEMPQPRPEPKRP